MVHEYGTLKRKRLQNRNSIVVNFSQYPQPYTLMLPSIKQHVCRYEH
jgi:hypothetical protein